jgi:hypothetical protein
MHGYKQSKDKQRSYDTLKAFRAESVLAFSPNMDFLRLTSFKNVSRHSEQAAKY